MNTRARRRRAGTGTTAEPAARRSARLRKLRLLRVGDASAICPGAVSRSRRRSGQNAPERQIVASIPDIAPVTMAFRGSSVFLVPGWPMVALRKGIDGRTMSERRDPTSRITCYDCNRSFALDAGRLAAGTDAAMQCHHALCGAELQRCKLRSPGGKTVHVACTQETALFGELAETGAGERIRFFSLREHRQLVSRVTRATPKLAALIATATTIADPRPVAAVQMKRQAQPADHRQRRARRWAGRSAWPGSFEPAVLITARSKDVEAPAVNNVPGGSGRPVRLCSHLGAFGRLGGRSCRSISSCACAATPASRPVPRARSAGTCRSMSTPVAATAPASPPVARSARSTSARQDSARGERFDLRARPVGRASCCVASVRPTATPRLGAILRTGARGAGAGEFVGEFEAALRSLRGRPVRAHSRAKGPATTTASSPLFHRGDPLERRRDRGRPYLCKGRGTCSTCVPRARCPSVSARARARPTREDPARRIRARRRQRRLPVVSFRRGRPPRSFSSRRRCTRPAGAGDPSRGVERRRGQAGPDARQPRARRLSGGGARRRQPRRRAAQAQAGHNQAILSPLGYGGEHPRVIEADADDWWAFPRRTVRLGAATGVAEPARFRLLAKKRETLDFALRHLVAHAPATTTPADLPAAIALNAGALRQVIASDACTLCMSCTGACPAGAARRQRRPSARSSSRRTACPVRPVRGVLPGSPQSRSSRTCCRAVRHRRCAPPRPCAKPTSSTAPPAARPWAPRHDRIHDRPPVRPAMFALRAERTCACAPTAG